MDLISLVIFLIVVGLLVYLVKILLERLPIDPVIKNIIWIVLIIIAIVWCLGYLGVFPNLGNISLGRQ